QRKILMLMPALSIEPPCNVCAMRAACVCLATLPIGTCCIRIVFVYVKGILSMAGDQSEVAQLRQRIEKEYQAAQEAVSGFRQTGKHAFITASLDRIGNYQAQLATLIG